jgi:two-component system CheB/CheR fusion protein
MDDPAQSQTDEGKHQSKTPLIVGVGASAGSMDSIERFFSRLKLDPDQAIVLVLQYRDAVDDKRLREVLQRADGGKIADITDGLAPVGGAIHVCPADMITTLQDGCFAVGPAEQARGEHRVRNTLGMIRSIARRSARPARRSRAIPRNSTAGSTPLPARNRW